eukprot:7874616-Pyramimonas_sp.AAC.1
MSSAKARKMGGKAWAAFLVWVRAGLMRRQTIRPAIRRPCLTPRVAVIKVGSQPFMLTVIFMS